MFEQIEKLIEKLISRCKYGKARTLVKKALKTSRDKNALYRYLVWIYRMKGCPGEALFFLKKLERNADTLCEEAILYRMRCDFKRARRKISSAISTFRKQNDKAGLSFASWVKGGIERYGGEPGEGYKYFAASLKLSSGRPSRGYALCGLGGTARLLGKFDESLKNYRQANKKFERAKDRFGLAYSYCGIGSALRMKNNFRKSKEFYKKALSLYEKIGDDWNRAYSAWGFSQTLWFLKSKSAAVKINSGALKIFQKFKDRRGKFYCYIQSANFERMSGNFKRAKDLCLKCLKIVNSLKLHYEGKLLEKQKILIRKKDSAKILIP